MSWDYVYLWDVKTGEQKGTLTGHTGAVFSVVFSPDGKVLASGSRDETVRLWDTETWELKQTLAGYTTISFSPGWQDDCQWE